jgi:hypothetical protein
MTSGPSRAMLETFLATVSDLNPGSTLATSPRAVSCHPVPSRAMRKPSSARRGFFVCVGPRPSVDTCRRGPSGAASSRATTSTHVLAISDLIFIRRSMRCRAVIPPRSVFARRDGERYVGDEKRGGRAGRQPKCGKSSGRDRIEVLLRPMVQARYVRSGHPFIDRLSVPMEGANPRRVGPSRSPRDPTASHDSCQTRGRGDGGPGSVRTVAPSHEARPFRRPSLSP